MKIALIGATGHAGSRILSELAHRGHSVTAIVRHPDRVPALPDITAIEADVHDTPTLAKLLNGHDAVISSVHFLAADAPTFLQAIRRSDVRRYLVVGGAGTLEIRPGMRLVDTPDFPAAYHGESSAGAAFLETLRTVSDLDWTFLSPSAEFVEGSRTGKFRLGENALLTDSQGRSWISYEDYAVAMVDELEKPAHVRARFTVGY
ncbi:NAD(P)-dependent oxidoreductase [Trinickia terrae]|uniref:NAD(P)-dependent oxidoreductase n=1 Tax=Trinickia terrae TaxID=2571161 RepID=A0A4U1H9F1_9BURK|nr:NAD(P)-dependent oxidoreductase [Trinickia terrae]TKC77272.1 NAD(P)-dependent oxidoreductase [Trinickia terrae]